MKYHCYNNSRYVMYNIWICIFILEFRVPLNFPFQILTKDHHFIADSPDCDHGKVDKACVQPQEMRHPSGMETSVSFDTVFRFKQSPHDSGCFASNENVHRKEPSDNQTSRMDHSQPSAADSEASQTESGIHSEGVDSVILSSMNNLDVAIDALDNSQQHQGASNTLLNVRWPKVNMPDCQNVAENGVDSSNISTQQMNILHGESNASVPGSSGERSNNILKATSEKQLIPPPIPSRAIVPANLDQLKQQSRLSSMSAENPAIPPVQLTSSIPPINHHLWHDEAVSSELLVSSQRNGCHIHCISKNKKGRGLELNLSKKSSAKANTEDRCNKSKDDMCHQALMNQIVHKLNAEGINLTVVPYTDKVSICPSLQFACILYFPIKRCHIHCFIEYFNRLDFAEFLQPWCSVMQKNWTKTWPSLHTFWIELE